MKGSQQAELNHFADFISRKEAELRSREEEIDHLTNKVKEKDNSIMILERKNRH